VETAAAMGVILATNGAEFEALVPLTVPWETWRPLEAAIRANRDEIVRLIIEWGES
jgi:hypothetical protein